MSTRDKTAEMISAMLKENTGQHMLDSGGSPKYSEDGTYIGSTQGYGRSYERNAGVNFDAVPAASVSFSVYRYNGVPSVEIDYTKQAYAHCVETLEYAEDLTEVLADMWYDDNVFVADGGILAFLAWKYGRYADIGLAYEMELTYKDYAEGKGSYAVDDVMESFMDTLADLPSGCLSTLFEIVSEEEFQAQLTTHEQAVLDELLSQDGVFGTTAYGFEPGFSFNSYNEENCLSETLQGKLISLFQTDYVVLRTHNGCDVRGGYSSPKVFSMEDSFLSFSDGYLSAGDHHWYQYPYWECDDGGKRLEELPLMEVDTDDPDLALSPELREMAEALGRGPLELHELCQRNPDKAESYIKQHEENSRAMAEELEYRTADMIGQRAREVFPDDDLVLCVMDGKGYIVEDGELTEITA